LQTSNTSQFTDPSALVAASPGDPELAMAKPRPAAVKLPEDFSDMPRQKNKV